MNIFLWTILLSFTGLEIREEGKQSFLLCQTCNKTICKYISCNEEIQNSVFCVHQHVITFQTNSPRSSMDTTPIAMETNTQSNTQSATNSNRSTRNTTEQGKTSEKESTNETAPKYGKFLHMKTLPHNALVSSLRVKKIRYHSLFFTIMIAF